MNTLILIITAVFLFSMGTHAYILQLEKTTHAQDEIKELNEQLSLQLEYYKQLVSDYETIGLEIEELIDPVFKDLLELNVKDAAQLIRTKRRLEKRRALTLKTITNDQKINPSVKKPVRATRGSQLLLAHEQSQTGNLGAVL